MFQTTLARYVWRRDAVDELLQMAKDGAEERQELCGGGEPEEVAGLARRAAAAETRAEQQEHSACALLANPAPSADNASSLCPSSSSAVPHRKSLWRAATEADLLAYTASPRAPNTPPFVYALSTLDAMAVERMVNPEKQRAAKEAAAALAKSRRRRGGVRGRAAPDARPLYA